MLSIKREINQYLTQQVAGSTKSRTVGRVALGLIGQPTTTPVASAPIRSHEASVNWTGPLWGSKIPVYSHSVQAADIGSTCSSPGPLSPRCCFCSCGQKPGHLFLIVRILLYFIVLILMFDLMICTLAYPVLLGHKSEQAADRFECL